MRSVRTAIVSMLMLAACGCGPLTASAGHTNAARRETILVAAFDDPAHLYRAYASGIADSGRFVLRDSAAYLAFWSRLAHPRGGPMIPPAIDFRVKELIVAARGRIYSEGPMISIDTVKLEGGDRVVVVRQFMPLSVCIEEFSSRGSQPLDIVVVPRDTVSRTRFVERIEHLKDCGPDAGRPSRKPIP
jgi:hypothetical protein